MWRKRQEEGEAGSSPEDRPPAGFESRFENRDGGQPIRRAILAITLLAVLVLAAYGSTFRGGFVWDDVYLVVENQAVQEPGHLLALLTKHFWELGDPLDRSRSFYRPLTSLTYLIDRATWQSRPAGFHFTNVYLHFLASFAGFLFLSALLRSARPALLASLAFALHPVHVESVAWISGRTDVLCALFLFLSLWLHLLAEDPPPRPRPASRERLWLRILSVACFALSLAAKEMSLTLPLLLLLVDAARDPGRPILRLVREKLRGYLPYLGVLGLYLAVRLAVMGAVATNLARPAPWPLALTVVHVVARYLGLLAIPIGLDPHHPDALVKQPSAAWALEAAVLLSLAVAAVRLKRRHSLLFFALAWTGITLLPVLDIGSFGDVILADRFLYIPSLGFCLLAALLFERCVKGLRGRGRAWSGIPIAIFVLFLSFMGVRTREASAVWRDNLTLFSRMLATSPGSPYVRGNLGLALFGSGRLEEAVQLYQTSLAIMPRSTVVQNLLGIAYESLGRMEEAKKSYRRAAEIVPDYPPPYFNLANAELRSGDCREEIGWYRGPNGGKPEFREARVRPIACAPSPEALALSARLLEKAVALEPRFDMAWDSLGLAYFRMGDLSRAEQTFRRAVSIDPGNRTYAANLSETIGRPGRGPGAGS